MDQIRDETPCKEIGTICHQKKRLSREPHIFPSGSFFRVIASGFHRTMAILPEQDWSMKKPVIFVFSGLAIARGLIHSTATNTRTRVLILLEVVSVWVS
jgi:hypothetical protein